LLFILGGIIGGGEESNPTVGSAVILGLHSDKGLGVIGTILKLMASARRRAFGPEDTAKAPTTA
jgi:hypothetical protein